MKSAVILPMEGRVNSLLTMTLIRYKNYPLIHNTAYPLDYSSAVIDLWEEASGEEPIKSELASITKRRFIAERVFIIGNEAFRAKFYRTVGAKRRIEAMLVKAESVRSYRAGLRVAEAGLATPKPLCVWGSWTACLHDWSVLFMADLGVHVTLPDFLNTLNASDHEAKSRVSIALAKDLAKLHDAGVYVYDPAKNVLVRNNANRLEFVFIDFDTVKWFMAPTKNQVARVLRHCIRPPGNLDLFNPEEKAAYTRAYLESRGLMKWFDAIYPLV